MGILEIVDQGLKLLRVLGCRNFDDSRAFGTVVLEFENSVAICLGVDVDTDELILGISERVLNCDLNLTQVILEGGEFVPIWFWEMKNQKEYFDALQIEFFEKQSSAGLILQFKVEASEISAFLVDEIRRQP